MQATPAAFAASSAHCPGKAHMGQQGGSPNNLRRRPPPPLQKAGSMFISAHTATALGGWRPALRHTTIFSMPRREAPPQKNRREKRQSTDFGTTAQASALLHRKDSRRNVATDNGVLIQVAPVATHIALHMAIDIDLAGLDIALDVGQLANRHLAGIRLDLAIDLAIDMHIVLKANGTDNLNTLGQNIRSIRTHE